MSSKQVVLKRSKTMNWLKIETENLDFQNIQFAAYPSGVLMLGVRGETGGATQEPARSLLVFFLFVEHSCCNYLYASMSQHDLMKVTFCS